MHRSSFCGVNCKKCNVYVATVTDDDALRERVIDEWGKLYRRSFTKEDINCLGCKSDSLFGLCAKCDIKPCNEKRGLKNCEDCAEFPCERMRRFFDYHEQNATGNVFD